MSLPCTKPFWLLMMTFVAIRATLATMIFVMILNMKFAKAMGLKSETKVAMASLGIRTNKFEFIPKST